MNEPAQRAQRWRPLGFVSEASRSIRGRLLTLLLVGAVPGAAVAALDARHGFREAQRGLQRRVTLLRDVVLTRELVAIEATGRVLAAVASLVPAGNRAAEAGCGEALAAAAGPGGDGPGLALTDAAGTVVCASRRDLLGRRFGDRGWFMDLARGRGPVIGQVEEGADGLPALLLAAPLPGVGAAAVTTGAVVARLPMAPAVGRPGGTDVPSEAVGEGPLIWVLDATGRPWPLTAATRDTASAGLPPLGAALADPTGAAMQAEGTSAHVVAVGQLGGDLRLVVAASATGPLAAARREALLRFTVITTLFLLSAAIVVAGVNASVVGPLHRLRDAVANWRDAALPIGGDRDTWPTEFRDVAEGCERAAARLAAHEAELRAALERSELLMAEVHHRVKNNLQIVSSLLNLQGARITEPAARAEFEAARDRVRALATLHRHLYMHPDHETIDLRAFIEELAGQIFQASGERPNERIGLSVEAPSLRISSDQAVPLALVITEAVTNALAYAFPGGRRGRLEVALHADAERGRLSVHDDGVGGGLDRAADRRGLGNQLVRNLARQLGGELRVETSAGTVVTLDFPLRPPMVRPPPSAASLRPRPPGGEAPRS